MKCNGCSTPMVLERTESGLTSSAEWYHCPLCGKVRMTCSKLSLSDDSQQSYAGIQHPQVTLTGKLSAYNGR